jgi:hypothetical protein
MVLREWLEAFCIICTLEDIKCDDVIIGAITLDDEVDATHLAL